MAKRTIIVGINQTTMAALSMATIAAFINGPGLGQPVVRALNALPRRRRVRARHLHRADGDHARPGHHGGERARREAGPRPGRATTAARAQRPAAGRRGRSPSSCVYLSRHYVFAAKPRESDLGDRIANGVQSAVDWISDELVRRHDGHLPTASPTRSSTRCSTLLAGTPWFVTAPGDPRDRVILGGWRAGVAAVICLAGSRWLDLWNNAMITLTATLVATVLRDDPGGRRSGSGWGAARRWTAIIRPVLDAGQTMPPFVYLIPVLALFGATRFTAIVAASLRRPGRDQDRRGRHQGGLAGHRRGGRVGRRDHDPDHHQGADPDGPVGVRRRRQPGAALRAVDGRHRRPGRCGRARLRRRRRLQAARHPAAAGSPPASRSCCSASCSTGSRRTRAAPRGRAGRCMETDDEPQARSLAGRRPVGLDPGRCVAARRAAATSRGEGDTQAPRPAAT